MNDFYKIKVTFEPEGKSVLVDRGTTILKAAILAGLGIRSDCGGLGTCGKCKVLVRDPEIVSDITEVERKFLSSEDLEKGVRLACQARIIRNGRVYLPSESREGERRIIDVGFGREVPVEPVVKKIHLIIPKPSLSDVRADYERIVDTLVGVLKARGDWKDIYDNRIRINHELLRIIPNILREAGWDITLVLREGEILEIEKGDTKDQNYGLAIDIGTSKVVIYLINVNEGRVVGKKSMENPQLMFGEDIMSRLTFAMKSPENRSLLQKVLIDGINEVIEEIIGESGVDQDKVYEAVVVGNTAMHHLFVGIDTKYLAISPYVPAIREPVNVKAEELGLVMKGRGYVTTLPIIGGFVGADGVADLLATGIYESEEISLLLDIGTNTEVFLGNRDGIVACSAASGPAFEGGHIKFGMKASTGAIDRVEIDPETFEVRYGTIGGTKPIGLCGSALIDVVAELLKCGLIDVHGKMNQDVHTPRMRKVGKYVEFVLVWSNEAGIDEDISVSQKDVREIQLAKAAIYTAQYILTKRMGIQPRDIKRILVAGAFGSGINLENAICIGLLPEEYRNKVEFVGNTAISGARIALISESLRKESKDLARLIDYIELSTDPSFEREFIDATELPHKDLRRFPTVKRLLDER